MAYSSYTPLVVYPGDGTTTTFAIPDKFYDEADVSVFYVTAAGVETSKELGDDFTISVTAIDSTPPARKTGNIVLTVAAPVNTDVVVFLQPTNDQDQQFEGRIVTPRQQERVHDRHSMRDAALREFFYRGFRAPLNSTPALRYIAIGDTGDIPVFDADGNLVIGPKVGDVNIVADIVDEINAVAEIAADVTTVSGIADHVSTAAGISGNITTVAAIASAIIIAAGIDTEITQVAAVAAATVIVAGIDSEVSIVSSIASAVAAVGAIDDDVSTVAANIADIIAAAENVADLADKLNKDGSNVTTDADRLIFADAVKAVSYLAQTLTAAQKVQAQTNFGLNPADFGMVRLDGANGFGSTNTKIARFTNVRTNKGSDITYADSAALGASFTIAVDGVYSITYTENFTDTSENGLSLNSVELTTNIAGINPVNRLSMESNAAATFTTTVAWSGFLAAGSVVRPHSAGTGRSVAGRTAFTIARTA